MRLSRNILMTTIFALFGGIFVGAPWATAAESIFPETVTSKVNGKSVKLKKTGESTRNFLFFQVYRIAHYAPASLRGSVLKSRDPKQINMVFSRAIDAERIRNDFQKILKERVSEKEWKAISKSVSKFCAPITQGVKKGDTFVLNWQPNGVLTSRYNGKLLSQIKDPTFARAMWSLWFGPDSVVNREDLLRNVTG